MRGFFFSLAAISATLVAMQTIATAQATEVSFVRAFADGNVSGGGLDWHATSSYESRVDAPLGLTSDAVSVGTCGPGATGASAAASLAQGVVRSCASGASIQGVATASAGFSEIFDTLTFHIEGATDRTVTNIGIKAHLDGTVAGSTGAASSFILRVGGSLGPVFVHDVTGPDAGRPATVQDSQHSWVSYDIENSTVGGVDFSALFSVGGANPQETIDLSLETIGQDGSSSDFSNTGFLNLVLPDGVTFSSASGVFLTAPMGTTVPEPGTGFLLAGTLIGLASLRHRFRS